jgi:phosphomannomutase
LADEPAPLRFGTSGRRGRVRELTQLEIYVNVLGEIGYLQSQPSAAGGIAHGGDFCFAHDLRPSSGDICQAVVEAVRDSGMRPVALGAIPTPALACYAWSRGQAGIMVTGSHIPFDWNGYKLNTSRGELMKTDEAPIAAMVEEARRRIYAEPAVQSKFDAHGRLKAPKELPAPVPGARACYLRRYTEFFAGRSLAGARILLYEHSAVGRELLREILEAFGAEVIPAGRRQTFVPIDTENIEPATLASLQELADAAAPLYGIVSTDGDSDRPLILGLENRAVRFFPGDIVGMVTAEFLGADAVVVPVSSNDAIDRGHLRAVLEPKTRIGSPYVIAGMEAARAKGRVAVCGWEANGGFLLGSDLVRDGRTLPALTTRDAVLPILCVLFAARSRGLDLPGLFAELPPRYTHSTLIRDFPRPLGLRLAAQLTPVDFEPLFGPAAAVDRTDGLRITFAAGDVIHLRPSGNADEFRIYACADTRPRAEEITRLGAEAVRNFASAAQPEASN